MVDEEAEFEMGTNPAQGVHPNDDGTTDLVFYDTEDPSNTKDDPVVERRFTLDDDQIEEMNERLGEELGHGVDHPLIAQMLVDRETIWEILEEITDG